jgi:hypothetical protein
MPRPDRQKEGLSMPLSSNGIPLETTSAPMRDSAPNDPGLRARFLRDGYVLIRGLLDREPILRLRGSYFAMFDPSYLAEGTRPEDGVWSGAQPGGLPAHGVAGHPAHAMARSSEFERLTRDGRLLSLAEQLLGGEEVMRLPRQIVRHFHQGPQASRAHTDFAYLDRGSDRVLTMWIPLGDCPAATGGITYLEDSHRLPRQHLDALKLIRTDRPGDSRPISHDLNWTRRQLGGRWLTADFQAGDVAVHSPHLVHATLDNSTPKMRLSADIRFLPITVEPDPRWLRPWAGDDGN